MLSYRVTVESVTGAAIANSAYVDWTSLDGPSAAERTGGGCPNITAPDDYCYGPATVGITTIDNTALTKAVVADSYAEIPASTTDPVVRVGDTVTYDLTLHLQEYTTRNVVVVDALPAGDGAGEFHHQRRRQFQLHPGGATGGRRHRHPALGVRRHRQPAEQRRHPARSPW